MSKSRHEIFDETSEAPVWYLQLWETLTSDASDKDLISLIDKSGLLRSIIVAVIPIISLILLIAPGVNSWDALKNYRAASNRNFDRTLDLVVNVLTTIASVALMASLMVGIVYFSPYILAGVLSLGFAYGVYNVAKHCYRAYRAHREKDFLKRDKELWAIPRHIILTILNGLGLITHLHYAFNFTQLGGVFDLVTLPNGTFSIGEIIIYSCGMLMTLSTLPLIARKVMEYNAETYQFVTHPITGTKNILNNIWQQCVKQFNLMREEPINSALRVVPNIIGLAITLIGVAVTILSHALALMLAPVQLFAQGIHLGYKKLKERYSPSDVYQPLDSARIAKMTPSTALMTRKMLKEQRLKTRSDLATKHAEIHQRLAERIGHLEHLEHLNNLKLGPELTPKHKAKLSYLLSLRDKMGKRVEDYDNIHTLQDIEDDAKRISPYLFQSFWKDEGKVERIARMAYTYDVELQKASEEKAVKFSRAVA